MMDSIRLSRRSVVANLADGLILLKFGFNRWPYPISGHDWRIWYRGKVTARECGRQFIGWLYAATRNFLSRSWLVTAGRLGIFDWCASGAIWHGAFRWQKHVGPDPRDEGETSREQNQTRLFRKVHCVPIYYATVPVDLCVLLGSLGIHYQCCPFGHAAP